MSFKPHLLMLCVNCSLAQPNVVILSGYTRHYICRRPTLQWSEVGKSLCSRPPLVMCWRSIYPQIEALPLCHSQPPSVSFSLNKPASFPIQSHRASILCRVTTIIIRLTAVNFVFTKAVIMQGTFL